MAIVERRLHDRKKLYMVALFNVQNSSLVGFTTSCETKWSQCSVILNYLHYLVQYNSVIIYIDYQNPWLFAVVQSPFDNPRSPRQRFLTWVP